jgi:hypothetical protein
MKEITDKDIHPNLRVPWKSKADEFIPDLPNKINYEERLKYEESVKEYETKNPISSKIKEIPHLKLNAPKFDYESAWDEVQKLDQDSFSQCNLRNYKETLQKGPLLHPHWYSKTMVNYTPYSWTGQGKQAKEEAAWAYPEFQPYAASIVDKSPTLSSEDMQFYKTEIYDQLPTTTNFINEHIADKTYRMHVWKIKDGGYLNWHNHIRLPWQSNVIVNDKAIVHLALHTHPDINMLVKKNDKIYAEHYSPGETWVFNYIYDHAVDNPTTVFRCHIVFYVPLTDKKFCKLVERSLQK